MINGWYAALCQNGCLPEIVRDIDLVQGIPPGFKLIILPMQVIEVEGIRQALFSWVKSGGHLVASGQTFLYDQSLYAQKRYPGADLFGVQENETDPYDGFIRYFRNQADFDFPAGGRRIDCILAGAKAIGSIGSKPLITEYGLGHGTSIWFGCSPGRKHAFSSIDGFMQVVGDLINTAGVKFPVNCTQGVVASACPVQNGILLFLVNLTGQDTTTWIRLNGRTAYHAVNLLDDTVACTGESVDRFPVSLLAEQSKILLLQEDITS